MLTLQHSPCCELTIVDAGVSFDTAAAA